MGGDPARRLHKLYFGQICRFSDKEITKRIVNCEGMIVKFQANIAGKRWVDEGIITMGSKVGVEKERDRLRI